MRARKTYRIRQLANMAKHLMKEGKDKTEIWVILRSIAIRKWGVSPNTYRRYINAAMAMAEGNE